MGQDFLTGGRERPRILHANGNSVLGTACQAEPSAGVVQSMLDSAITELIALAYFQSSLKPK